MKNTQWRGTFLNSPRTLSGVFFLFACLFCPVGLPDLASVEPGETQPGGEATSNGRLDANAFSHASSNLGFRDELNFKVGNGFFRRVWISSPASTQAADGLGPLFNSRGCQRCHIKDGRGHPPADNETPSESFLIKLSIPPQTDQQRSDLASGHISSVAEPGYGNQLQGFSVQGVNAEGKVRIDHESIEISVPDGGSIILQQPIYSVVDLPNGPLHPQTRLGPRVAPQMIGLGLLEAIHAEDILAWSDPDDKNNDGISGRPNKVWDRELNEISLGRFGHKASAPSLNQQNQNAFNTDIGLSTPLFPDHHGDCTEQQTDCLSAPNGASPQYDNLEVHGEIADLVLFYTRNLAVPARRGANNPDVVAGKQLFTDIGCAACHRPSYETGTLEGQSHLSGQRIWPYTDLLLHDMGQALADGFSDGQASGSEWRTAPLWGIGLTRLVNGHSLLLHDGRANGVREAIHWHGGEATNSRTAFLALSEAQQLQLIRFVESL